MTIPGYFEIDYYGTKGANFLEYRDFLSRKVRGNILLTVYYTPVTIQEISIELGFSLPYLEDEIKLLVERQYLVCSNGKYLTNIPIFTSKCTKAIDEKLESLTSENAQKFIAVNDEFDARFGDRFPAQKPCTLAKKPLVPAFFID